MSGTLYLVATPIGNLEDITYRAVRILGEVDLIACEDTRHTRHLLDHYGIRKPALSYHEHNETERAAELVERLQQGSNVAIVSDAGTPLVSDPGFRVVRAAIAAGIRVVPIPGASATLTALAAAGLPTDSFYFGGFLPPKQMQRRKALEDLRSLGCTLVFYEAPHRIVETLEELVSTFGDPEVVLTRELTKMHEEFLRGTASTVLKELQSRPSIKGEMTLLVSKPNVVPAEELPIGEAVQALVDGGMPRMDAIKQIARERGLSKRDVYAQFDAVRT